MFGLNYINEDFLHLEHYFKVWFIQDSTSTQGSV
jgi:hypothetical protein